MGHDMDMVEVRMARVAGASAAANALLQGRTTNPDDRCPVRKEACKRGMAEERLDVLIFST